MKNDDLAGWIGIGAVVIIAIVLFLKITGRI